MECAVGDTVIHPQHGTATVERVLTKDLGAGPVEYFQLQVTSNAMTIMVPAASIGELNIRAVSSKTDAEAILDLLADGSDVPQRWADRNPATTARMRSGDISQIAMVARDLTHHARRSGKPLSQSEQASLDRCLGLLSAELSLSLGMTPHDVLALIAERIPEVDVTNVAPGPRTSARSSA